MSNQAPSPLKETPSLWTSPSLKGSIGIGRGQGEEFVCSMVAAVPPLLGLFLQIDDESSYMPRCYLLQGKRMSLMFKKPDQLAQPVRVGADWLWGVLLALMVQDVDSYEVSNILNSICPRRTLAGAGDMV
jgi:hypothetical protein